MWSFEIFKAIHVDNFQASLPKAERLKILFCFSPCSATTDLSSYQDMQWMKPPKPHRVLLLPNTRERLSLCNFLTNRNVATKTNVSAVKAHSISV